MKKTTKQKIAEAYKRDLIISTVIFAVWTLVVQLFAPVSWVAGWPVLFGILVTLSPFIVAAVLAYEFLFRQVAAKYTRISYAVVFAILVFMLSMVGTWVVPVFPSSLMANAAMGDVLAVLWMTLFYLVGAAVVVWYIHATAPMRGRRARRA